MLLANRCGILKQNVIMSIQENQISDQIDGGLLYKKEIVNYLDEILKQNKNDKQQTDYQLFLLKRTFPDKSHFYQRCRDLLSTSEKTEKDIIKDHLDTIVKTYLYEQSNVDALPYFIRQFEEEITDTWSVLEFLKYLKDNDFQIL